MAGQTTTWIATSNRGFSAYAVEELKRLFADVRFQPIVPAEINLFTVQHSFSDVVRRLSGQEPVFLRHIQPVQLQNEINESLSALRNSALLVQQLLENIPMEINSGIHNFWYRSKVAVQVRKQEGIDPFYSPLEMKQAIDVVLANEYDCDIVVRDADWILSVYITGELVYTGISRPMHNLSDWSGGAVRFAREEGQVSRAKFKLLEAEQKFALDFSQFRTALDIGAAPGGWTSLLLERGLKVTAVDPAALDPLLVHHPRLTFLRHKADEVSFAKGQFDLLVCDMSWSPQQMTKLINGLLYALENGGTAIITLKLMHGKPFRWLKETAETFGTELRLIKAKQLFHNRQEVTLYLTKG